MAWVVPPGVCGRSTGRLCTFRACHARTARLPSGRGAGDHDHGEGTAHRSPAHTVADTLSPGHGQTDT